MNIKGMNLVGLIDPYKLTLFQANPTGRVWKKSLDALVDTLRKDGRIYYRILIGKDGIVGDGHRRIEAAKILKFPTVPYEIIPERTAAELFYRNSTSKPVKGKDWLETYILGNEEVPAKQLNFIQAAEAFVGGKEVLRDLWESSGHSFSPSVVDSIRRVVSYVGDTSTGFVQRTAFWMVELRQQKPSRDAIEDMISKEELVRCINLGEKLGKSGGKIK